MLLVRAGGVAALLARPLCAAARLLPFVLPSGGSSSGSGCPPPLVPRPARPPALPRSDPHPQVKAALPALARLIHSQDEEVLTDACWALSYLSDGTNDKIQARRARGCCGWRWAGACWACCGWHVVLGRRLRENLQTRSGSSVCAVAGQPQHGLAAHRAAALAAATASFSWLPPPPVCVQEVINSGVCRRLVELLL